jgi:hypothetical protein
LAQTMSTFAPSTARSMAASNLMPFIQQHLTQSPTQTSRPPA